MTMIRNRTLLLATALLLRGLPIHGQTEAAKAQVDAVVREIKAGNVARAELLGVPLDAQFRVNVTPDRLESWWDYKLIIRSLDALLRPRAEEVAVALGSAVIQPNTTKLDFLDVRCGVLFYLKTPEDKRIASLYFDKSGRHGAVNNVAVSFTPDLLPRLKKALHASID